MQETPLGELVKVDADAGIGGCRSDLRDQLVHQQLALRADQGGQRKAEQRVTAGGERRPVAAAQRAGQPRLRGVDPRLGHAQRRRLRFPMAAHEPEMVFVRAARDQQRTQQQRSRRLASLVRGEGVLRRLRTLDPHAVAASSACAWSTSRNSGSQTS